MKVRRRFDLLSSLRGRARPSVPDLVFTATSASEGDAGRDAGYAYEWNTDTANSDPGSGKLKGNNATLSSVTTLRVSETDDEGNNTAAVLDAWDSGTSTVRGSLHIREVGSPTNWAVFAVTAVDTAPSGYVNVTVAYVDGDGSFANNDPVAINFYRTGDKGNTGAAGDIAATIVDAKGDLIVATAADTVARKAVGSANGQYLRADSTESDGLEWARGRLYAVYPLLAVPILYWPLDSLHGATDLSGNARNGTADGGVSIGGYSGSPISGETTSTDFDNTDDAVTISYDPYVDGTVRTFAGWAYRDTDGGVDTIIGSSSTGAGSPRLTLSSGSTNVVWRANGTTGTTITWTAAWPGNTQWVHWVLIFDETNDLATLYINGVLVSAQADTNVTGAGNFQVGRRATSTEPFDGKQAHVGIWDRALTAAEIRALYLAAL